ncbi:MAG TPA: hypothetical protein VFF89_04075 [Sphingobium sp.]|nr:hypothetical protein [Sphingobium sp.]
MISSLDIITHATAAVVLTGWAGIGLKGWHGWLALKRTELELTARQMQPLEREPALPSTATRIDLADLKERIRKLEAIASGVDL